MSSQQPNGPTKQSFNLKFPVEVQSTKYTTLTLRRPKVKDTRLLIEKADKDPLGAQLDFMAQLAQVPPQVFEELDLEDMSVIRKWVESFTKGIET